MLVQDIMTDKVFTVRQDKKVLVAKDIMKWAKIRHIPVVDDKQRVVGIISRVDLLKTSLPEIGEEESRYEGRRHLYKIPIEEVMNEFVVTISLTATVQSAAKIMQSNQINCLLVIDKGALAGIVTATDMLDMIANMREVHGFVFDLNQPPAPTPKAADA